MKIAFIGNFDSPHTYKMAEYFVEILNYKIYAFSEYEPIQKHPRIEYYSIFPENSKFSIRNKFEDLLLRILKKLSIRSYYKYRIFLFNISGLFKELNTLAPDIVHAHFCSDSGRIAYYSGLTPYIVSCWGSDILIHPQKSKYLKIEITKVLQNSAYIHSCAQHLTDRIINDFEIPKNKIIEIQYGIKNEIINYLGDRENKLIEKKVPTIICTRAANTVYDNETIIKSAKIMQSRGIDVEFRMFTEGPLYGKYEKMIIDLGLKNFFLSHSLNQKDLFIEYKKSDIYLSASISDGLSISLLEAFASKLYPVVSDIVANRNVITHKANGLLFQMNNPESLVEQITYLLRNRNQSKSTIEKNYQWVKDNQCFEKNLQNISDLYKHVIDTKYGGKN